MAKKTMKEALPEPPQWSTDVSVMRLKELFQRGETILARGAPQNDRAAWGTAVDHAMAAAFGRASPEHVRVIEAMRVFFLVAGAPDDYPDRLKGQLARIAEYVRILEERRADELRAAPVAPAEPSAVKKLVHLLGRFSRAANHLKVRRAGRPPLVMEDEYDVQYLLQSLLDVHFDDVRPEEFGPSVAGRNVRIDFVLESEKIAVEAKRTRDTLRDKEVGDELLVDIARYKKHPSCKTLVCFVYDPEGLLRNPDGLENDLTRVHDGLDVRVIVRPKH